jgi:hypothetical protein
VTFVVSETAVWYPTLVFVFDTRLGRCYLKRGIVCDIGGEDVDVGAAIQIRVFGHLLVGRRLVSDETDYDVVCVARILSKELVLGPLVVDV